MKEIRLQVLDKLRYKSAGDYLTKDNIQYIYSVKQKCTDYEFLVLLHELVEWYMTERAGIREEDILAYDLAHPDSVEPGTEMDAPYRHDHNRAETVERIIAEMLGIDWQKYEQEIIVSE